MAVRARGRAATGGNQPRRHLDVPGRDDRLIVVVGPCSIHDHDQAMDYARQLKAQADALAGEPLVVSARLLREALHHRGLEGLHQRPAPGRQLRHQRRPGNGPRPAAGRAGPGPARGHGNSLDLLSPQFISDLAGAGALSARAPRKARATASWPWPVLPRGFKNGTDGGVKVASDAIQAASAPHAFMGMTKMGQSAIFETRGNGDCHVILRGGKQPNYGAEHAGCPRPAGRRRPAPAGHDRCLPRQQQQAAPPPDRRGGRRGSADRRWRCLHHGLMAESHLQEGRQDIVDGQPLAWLRHPGDRCLHQPGADRACAGAAGPRRSGGEAAGGWVMYSAIQSQASAILLLAEPSPWSLCSSGNGDIQNREMGSAISVHQRFIVIDDFLQLSQLLHCLYSCCSMKYQK
ncbi:Plasma membrane calcium-transporting ATPase 2 [Manis javanica]|nr:Plasma membrane calcium-transporting ATPase 2 [Manis javanica]